MNKQKYQSGSAHLVIILVIVLAVIGVLGYVYYQNFIQKKTTSSQVDSKYISKEDNFKINFPQFPKVTDLGENNYKGSISTGKLYELGSNETKKYGVIVTKTSNGAIADWNKDDGLARGGLSSAGEIIESNINNSDVSKRFIIYQNRTALQISAIKKTTEDKRAFYIAFFNKADEYDIYMGGVGVTEKEFMNFADSFSFIN